MKTAEHARACARELRAVQGTSIKQIACALGVSQSSVSLWVRDVPLSDAQRSSLLAREGIGAAAGRKVRVARALAERRRAQSEGRELARSGDPFFAAGCMLFWAEGSRERNAVKFTNSDPAMMAFFMRFLRRYFGVRDDMVRVWCNLFADHLERQQEIEQFWLDTLELPRRSLTKSTVNVYSKHSKKTRTNKLAYGTCRVAVHRTSAAQALYGAVQELAGFDRDEWATM